MAHIKVDINPDILRWAREEAGYTIDEITSKLAPLKKYASWETDGRDVPLGKLKKIANSYKRQVAVFLLPEVPEKISRPKDYRNLSPAKSKLSKEVLLVLRRSARLQHLALELQGESYWKSRYEWLNELGSFREPGKTKNEEVTSWLRKKVGITIEDQLQWKSAGNEVYKKWRLALEEKLGLLVFQFPMPMKELQGFCLTDSVPYVIVTNSNHSYFGRVFTLCHELAHIMRHQSGMCVIDFTNTIQEQEERECNRFAADFLVPKNTLVPTDNLEKIKERSKKLGVSREVYLRRLSDEGYLSKETFFQLLDQIKATYDEGKKRRGGYATPKIKSKASRGETFFNMVLDAVNSNRISYSEASHALDLRVSRLVNEL